MSIDVVQKIIQSTATNFAILFRFLSQHKNSKKTQDCVGKNLYAKLQLFNRCDCDHNDFAVNQQQQKKTSEENY